jgi:hypothetical protein
VVNAAGASASGRTPAAARAQGKGRAGF